MLSESIIWKSRIYEICKRSGDILPGTTFEGVRFARGDEFVSLPTNVAVVCCGKISNDELLFRTEDGRYYFSLCNGWGGEDGVLYGLTLGICFDFRHPTLPETVGAECDAVISTYRIWGGAMAYQARRREIAKIRAVMG